MPVSVSPVHSSGTSTGWSLEPLSQVVSGWLLSIGKKHTVNSGSDKPGHGDPGTHHTLQCPVLGLGLSPRQSKLGQEWVPQGFTYSSPLFSALHSARTHTQTLTYMHTQAHTQTHSLTHTHTTCAHTHTHKLTLSHTHIHTLTCTGAHTHELSPASTSPAETFKST